MHFTPGLCCSAFCDTGLADGWAFLFTGLLQLELRIRDRACLPRVDNTLSDFEGLTVAHSYSSRWSTDVSRGLRVRRAMSIHAEEKKLVEKHAIEA